MLSYVASGLVLSQLQDKYGRRPLIWVGLVLELLGTICCILSQNMTQYIISRFFVGLGGSGRKAFIVMSKWCASWRANKYIGQLVTENSGPKHRSTVTVMSELGWAAGYVLLPLYAYLLRDYIYMNWGSVGVQLVLMVWFFWLDESPRWQLATGRIDQAKVTLKKALRINGRTNETLDADLDDLSSYLSKVDHFFIIMDL